VRETSVVAGFNLEVLCHLVLIIYLGLPRTVVYMRWAVLVNVFLIP
jgi:hypothetical protein